MRSYDGIMKNRFYLGTTKIINLSIEIGKLLGTVDASNLRKPLTELRRSNRIKTIQSSLGIEGNTLTLDQVTDIFENKRVIGPANDIVEVKNAIRAYGMIDEFNPYQIKSYLQAHKVLMQGLVEKPGKFRTKGVGIFKGEQVTHMAPPAWNIDHLMKNLFKYLKSGKDNLIIKSCVFHYEMEFIHPFTDGNGRMGRLWQTVILMVENPVFKYLPIEIEIKSNQQKYYDVLAQSDRAGVCTVFVEFMLEMIRRSLEKLVREQRQSFSDLERIRYFREQTNLKEFYQERLPANV